MVFMLNSQHLLKNINFCIFKKYYSNFFFCLINESLAVVKSRKWKKNDVGLVQILLKNDNTLSLEDYWELQAIGKLHKFDNSLI